MNFRSTASAVLSCVLFLFATSFAAAQEEPLKILFIGNSFTYANSLNDAVGDLFTVSGVPTETLRCAPGGWTFKRHFNGDVPKNYKGIPTPEGIAQQKWDVVVLQEYSSGAVEKYDDFMEYGQKLVEKIRENNPETKIVLYATWERCDGMYEGYGDDATRKEEVVAAWTKRYSAPSEKTVERLRVGIAGGYEELQKATDSLLAPVGKAFLKAGNDFDLFSEEGAAKPYHPNPRGTYLAACVIYKTLSKKSPVGLWKKLEAVGKPHDVTGEDAAALEKVADSVVEVPLP